jgi:16S rRNA G966 N2-methylase RsmD
LEFGGEGKERKLIMPKRKLSPRQPSLFPQKPIPQMPEGYYSSGPNPNLWRFVEEHATPYDPETDTYRVPPFDKPITTSKATAIYNMHTYWSKKPHDAIREYIKHYTKPGDIVLDPFCGSGGTALAALMEGRAAIAIDLSPAATFITKNYCTPVDVDELQCAYEELQRKVKPEMDWLYETRCDRCDGRATTTATIYSQVFQCPKCLSKVPLFDCIEIQSQTHKGETKTISVCPVCFNTGHYEEISTRAQKLGLKPVLISYVCEEGCKPRRGDRRHDDDNEKKRAYFNEFDLVKLAEIDEKQIPYWYPNHRMLNAPRENERWGLLWRPYHLGINTVADFFTSRNLWALSKIWHEINILETEYKSQLQFVFTSIVLKSSKMMAHNSDGIGRIQKGTLYIPATIHDVNVCRFFEEAFDDVIAGYKAINVESGNLIISTDDARLLNLPPDSLDFIFTDPPYSWKVQFGESNFIWEAWLGFDSTWLDREIIVNEVRQKDEHDWESGMQYSMRECYRVLKPGHWLSMCYHDTSEGTWQLLQDLMTYIGFISDKTDKSLYIDASQKSIKQITASQVAKRDLVISFRKPYPGELGGQGDFFDVTDAVSFRQAARAVLVEALTAHPGAAADRLYDELVSRLVRKGQFERHNFDELLRSVAEEVDGRWYLLETAGQIDEAESKKEEAAAKRLENYMQKILAEQRDAMGVHYSDLFEQYLPIKDKPRRLLQDWLPEFFYKTPEGTWRPPANEEERQQKTNLRSSGALRKIKRFANALLDGVPPAERDRPENAVTLADWIRQCRRAGLFELGRVLYEKGGMRFDELNEETQLLVEEDYQICVGKSNSRHKKIL